MPDHSALLVERLLGAGGIMVGKTATPEFAYSSFTHSRLWGVTRNPWNTERSPGGSSGGSGAAVASGCVPLAEGTDMGGSVRIPASWSGVVGLKPSFGRIPLDFLPTQFDTIHHFGPLARTIDDARLFLEVGAGPSERDAMSLPHLDLSSRTTDVTGLRLALDVDLGCWAVDPDVEREVRAAAAALADAGAIVEEVDLGWTRALTDAWSQHWGVYLEAIFGHVVDEYRDRMDPKLLGYMDAGRAMSAVDFKRLEFIRTDAWKQLAPVLEQYDALLCPTMSQAARPVDEDDDQWYADFPDGRFHGLDMTAVFNYMSQCPALSVPAGFTDDDLPVGLQIVARDRATTSPCRSAAPWSESAPGPPPPPGANPPVAAGPGGGFGARHRKRHTARIARIGAGVGSVTSACDRRTRVCDGTREPHRRHTNAHGSVTWRPIWCLAPKWPRRHSFARGAPAGAARAPARRREFRRA